jgi:hypothetical protein
MFLIASQRLPPDPDPIHLRGRTSGERCRVHERPAQDRGGQAISADKLCAPLIGRGAYHAPPAVHTRVKRDDKDERLRRIANQERSVQELGTTGQRGCPASPYRSIAMCMISNAVCARSDIRTFMSQSNSSSFSVSSEGTSTGAAPVSRPCMSCDRDGTVTAINGMAQP